MNFIFTFAGLNSDMHGVLCGKYGLLATRTLAEFPFPFALSEPVVMESSYFYHLCEGTGRNVKVRMWVGCAVISPLCSVGTGRAWHSTGGSGYSAVLHQQIQAHWHHRKYRHYGKDMHVFVDS